jgi:amidase
MTAYSTAYAASASNPPTVGKMWDAQMDRLVFIKKTLDHWVATKERTGTGRPIDALISATTPWAAAPKYGFDFYIPYTSTWNLTDQSATTFPSGHVGELGDVEPGWVGRNDKEKAIWGRCE